MTDAQQKKRQHINAFIYTVDALLLVLLVYLILGNNAEFIIFAMYGVFLIPAFLVCRVLWHLGSYLRGAQ